MSSKNKNPVRLTTRAAWWTTRTVAGAGLGFAAVNVLWRIFHPHDAVAAHTWFDDAAQLAHWGTAADQNSGNGLSVEKAFSPAWLQSLGGEVVGKISNWLGHFVAGEMFVMAGEDTLVHGGENVIAANTEGTVEALAEVVLAGAVGFGGYFTVPPNIRPHFNK